MGKISKSAKKQIINIVFLLVLIGITLAVLLINYKELNFKNIGEFIMGSNPWLLALAVLCMLAGIVFEALSLHVIAKDVGHKNKFVSSLAYSSANLYYSAITPFATGGQPASAYYMVKDGMTAGSASFAQLFNLIAYTMALVIMSVFAIIIRPSLFSAMEWGPKAFIIIGLIIQTLLTLFFIACMYCTKTVLKIGNGCITLLAKLHLVKKRNVEKWRNRLADEVEKYRVCVSAINKHKLLFIKVLLLDIAQRTAKVLISCCVCLAYTNEASFWDIFSLQTLVVLGYTSIPLPGGVGIFEYLYSRLYGLVYADLAIVVSAMMVMRTISYYICMIVTALYTLIYHIHIMRRKSKDGAPDEPIAQDGNNAGGAEESKEAQTSDEAVKDEVAEE